MSSLKILLGVTMVFSQLSPAIFQQCSGNTVRLLDYPGIPIQNGGLVELCVNQIWSRVCDSFWDRGEAESVCQQLGLGAPGADVLGYLVDDDVYSGPVVPVSCDPFGLTVNITIHDCIVTNTFLCPAQEFGVVICTSIGSGCVSGDIRLVGLQQASRGRLEACFLGVWGPVCDNSWRIANAIVACRQLGFSTVDATFQVSFTPQGTGPITLNDLQCTGAEATLFDCAHSVINRHDCLAEENVGVFCENPIQNQVTSEPPTTTLSSTTVILPSIGAILLLTFLLFMTVALTGTYFFKKRHSKRILTLSDQLEGCRNIGLREFPTVPVVRTNQLMPTSPAIKGTFIHQLTEDFVIPLMNVTLLEKIGEGEFGIVFKAKLSGASWKNQVVAVKTLKGVYSQEEMDAILEEGLKLKHFQHQNVLSLIGVCVEASPAPYIVIPFMTNGSLLGYLRKMKSALVLSDKEDEETVADATKRLTMMCQQISKGMKYLASERFVHRDLAARNCMIDENYVIKIADFGLSEDVYNKLYFRQESHTSVRLPVKWMALESIQEGIFSEKTDMWSFGVTMWEIFSGGKIPYAGASPIIVVQSLEQGERMVQPNNAACTKEMYEMMKLCWQQNPTERPTFATINEQIDKHLEEVAEYIDVETCLFPEIKHCEEEERKVTGFSRKRSSSDTDAVKVDREITASAS